MTATRTPESTQRQTMLTAKSLARSRRKPSTWTLTPKRTKLQPGPVKRRPWTSMRARRTAKRAPARARSPSRARRVASRGGCNSAHAAGERSVARAASPGAAASGVVTGVAPASGGVTTGTSVNATVTETIATEKGGAMTIGETEITAVTTATTGVMTAGTTTRGTGTLSGVRIVVVMTVIGAMTGAGDRPPEMTEVGRMTETTATGGTTGRERGTSQSPHEPPGAHHRGRPLEAPLPVLALLQRLPRTQLLQGSTLHGRTMQEEQANKPMSSASPWPQDWPTVCLIGRFSRKQRAS
mmetsp:Transcript_44384/g.99331  ORF Transcript_44384/g.99331 Transcript_44384/m.99331 type:complete len:297 (-) Transcript_44384:75-965(-)